jgi:hypothetical protein
MAVCGIAGAGEALVWPITFMADAVNIRSFSVLYRDRQEPTCGTDYGW